MSEETPSPGAPKAPGDSPDTEPKPSQAPETGGEGATGEPAQRADAPAASEAGNASEAAAEAAAEPGAEPVKETAAGAEHEAAAEAAGERAPEPPAEADAPTASAPEPAASNAPETAADPAPGTATEPAPDSPAEPAPDAPSESAPDAPAESAPDAPAEPAPDAPAESAPVAESGTEAVAEAGVDPVAEAGTEAVAESGAEAAAPAGETPPAGAERIRSPEEATDFVRSLRGGATARVPDKLVDGLEVRGVVAALEGETVVVDVAGKWKTSLPKLEFVDASGKVSVDLGDAVDLVVEEAGENPNFKRRSSPVGEAIGKIAEAFAARTPLEAEITSSIKGGFEAKIEGVRAFLPASQATLRRGDDKSGLVGRTVPVIVSKFDPSGRSIVVSRRKILEKERKQQAKETRESLKKGARFNGRVVALQAYGAFVDIGGLQGLLHLSEISWSRLKKPDEALKVGQRVAVVVLEHDESFKKISLSMKALQENPWKTLAEQVKPNEVRLGKVLRIVKSGAIVELSSGVECRLAMSELSTDGQLSPERKKELVGSEIPVQVVEIDGKRGRAALLAAPEGAEPGSVVEPPEVKAGAKIKGIVERIAPFGLFVRLGPGHLGLLHATESGTPPGTDLGKEFPAGTPLQVEVLEVNEEEKRIRLTRRTPFERMKDRERQAARGRGGPGGGRGRAGPGGRGGDRRGGRPSGPLINPVAAPKGGGFANLGDVLKRALSGGSEEPPAPAEEEVVETTPRPKATTAWTPSSGRRDDEDETEIESDSAAEPKAEAPSAKTPATEAPSAETPPTEADSADSEPAAGEADAEKRPPADGDSATETDGTT